MSDATFLAWPFFDEPHRRFAADLAAWAGREVDTLVDHADVDGSCRRLVAALGRAGWLKAAILAAYGGLHPTFDVRTLCIARETLAYRDGLADFAFAMQGLGTGSITLAGSDDLKARYLPKVARGEAIAAFALSEPEAGSDVAALATTATPDGAGHVRIDGLKTWISNGGIADHYVVFARTGEGPGAKGPRLSSSTRMRQDLGCGADRRDRPAPARDPAVRRLPRAALATRRRVGGRLQGRDGDPRRVPLDGRRGRPRLRLAGARRGAVARLFAPALRRAARDLQLTQGALAEMATAVDAAALLVYRAAWTKDQGAARITREAAMAKMYATEAAQGVIDKAVQIFGGFGVTKGVKVEELYREIRAPRIYEGATEVQKVVIARDLLKAAEPSSALRAAE